MGALDFDAPALEHDFTWPTWIAEDDYSFGLRVICSRSRLQEFPAFAGFFRDEDLGETIAVEIVRGDFQGEPMIVGGLPGVDDN